MLAKTVTLLCCVAATATHVAALLGQSPLLAPVPRQQPVRVGQPTMHVPYLFAAVGRPLQTELAVDKYVKANFSAAPNGLPGNDDLGSMSSWLVLSVLGQFAFMPLLVLAAALHFLDGLVHHGEELLLVVLDELEEGRVLAPEALEDLLERRGVPLDRPPQFVELRVGP